MKIVVDGFGGDNAPLCVLQGSEMAVKEYGVEIIITGDEEIIKKTAKENNISLDGIEIVHTTDVIEVCEDPTTILKEHNNSSMAAALKLLAEKKADAFVGAGSTGALVVGASLIVRRMKGIKRVALGTVIPAKGGCYMLMDSGANVECRPEMFKQFALMGSIYMENIIGVKNPRVALVNIGAEETKGSQLQIDSYKLLKESDEVNFIGNIEARDVPLGEADVVVADGFTGNVMLKLTEGLAKYLMGELKGVFTSGLKSKLAAAMVMKNIKGMKDSLDYKEYGGAPLLGSSMPVIKAHGSSDGYAFKNAIRQAKEFVETDVNAKILNALLKQKENKSE